mmetsp:Transcript_28881/g.51473  ORF Transcript_28881/g.51473 Transcript_28881/m.51473 type:complete len:686 (-) Transcript_28881:31-2088(-)
MQYPGVILAYCRGLGGWRGVQRNNYITTMKAMSFTQKRSESRHKATPAKHSRSQTGLPTRDITGHKSRISESFNVLPKEPKGLLSELRSRKRSRPSEVSPEVASQVIKNYLIPMFEAETQVKNAQARQSIFKTQSSESIKADKGTVYSELKLSDRLSDKLKLAESAIADLKRKLADAHQAKYEAEKELEHNKMDAVKQKASGLIWQIQCEEMKKAKQTVELTITLLKSQTRELRDTCCSLENQLKDIKEVLHIERASADKWRNRVVELEHSSTILRMSNDVMTEHLKGLYEAVAKNMSLKLISEKFESEVKTLCGNVKSLNELDKFLGENKSITLVELDNTQHELETAIKLQIGTKREKDRLSSLFKEYQQRMDRKMNDLTMENETLKDQADHLNKQFKNLGEEYEKVRQRVKQFRSKKKQYGMVEEKVCKRCQKVYNEAENYNWSCKTHSSEFGGEIFWCCGKKSKDAPGCRLAKHESKEDEEENSDAEGKITKNSSRRCVSCKQYGHYANDCPKDPNVRTNADFMGEMVRIKNVKSKKKSVVHIEVNELHSMLEQKQASLPFSIPQVTSPALSDDSEASLREELGNKMTTFPDIVSLKKSVAKQMADNLVSFESIVLKEAERELKGRKKSSMIFSPEKGPMSMMKASVLGSFFSLSQSLGLDQSSKSMESAALAKKIQFVMKD